MSARRFVKTAAQRRRERKIFLTFVLLALLAILCGYFLGNYFVYRTANLSNENKADLVDETLADLTDQINATNNDDKADNRQIKKNDTTISFGIPDLTLSLTPIQFYQVQVGAFQTAENGEKLIAELNSKGFNGGAVVFASPYYRVRIGAFNNRLEAEDLLQRLEKINYQGFIVQRTAHKNYNPEGKAEYLAQTQGVIKACSELINKLITINFGNGNSLAPDDSKVITQLVKQIEEEGKNLISLNSLPTAILPAHEQLVETVKIAGQLKQSNQIQNKVLELVESYLAFEEKLGI